MHQKQKPALPTFVWIAAVGIIAIICLIAIIMMRTDTEIMYAEIYQNGNCIRRVSLEEDAVFTIETDDGYNTIEVSDGRIRMIAADCRDQICVQSGVLTGSVPIVCLPHKLVIQASSSVSENADFEFDAVIG